MENSFLHETTYNSDIDKAIRREIETKFQRSITNKGYVFPRVNDNEIKQRHTRSTSRPRRPLS